MRLTKHHGLANDFLVALDEVNGRALALTGADAVDLCHRHTGVGADGLVHGEPPPPDRDDVDVVMHLFNADGSRAEMSGNGIRCFGQAVADARGIEKGTLRVATDDGVKVLDLEPGASPASMLVAVDMGMLRPGPPVPPDVAAGLGRHATVDIGNPHLVIEVDDPASIDLGEAGPRLEGAFGEGINVEFVVARARDRLDLVVWERGAGITQACGTGACAAASVAHELGLVDTEVIVGMPGGTARVELLPSGEARLIGPTVRIAAIDVDPMGNDPAGAP